MSQKYREYQQLNLPSIEQEILAKWAENQAFEKSVSLREGATPFVFYEGPPSANGMPGIHHVISRTLKDLVCRYKTMKGFQVKRKGGWDTHGLPIELGVEKELEITKEDIGKKISVEDYNKKCREAVLRYKDKWDDLTRKMGYWVDLNDPYITFKNEYIETLWWLLSELYKKGLLYESVSIQPYSPAAGTGLSSHELNQPGTYKDVKDTSAVAMFKAVRNEKSEFLFQSLAKVFRDGTDLRGSEVFFLAWTTTPWTLPSNLGLTVGGNIDYVLVKTFNPYLHNEINIVLAKALLGKYFRPENENADFSEYKNDGKNLPYKIITEFKGNKLEGCEYEQLLPYKANSLKVIEEETPGAKPFRVLVGDFVTTEEGTGIVHTAPAFGADDFKIGKKYNIGILTLVDREGKFVDRLGEFSNRYVKNYKDQKDYVDVNVDIAVKLKKDNRAFKVEKYEHSYPHCWRTDKPVLYYPLDAWFIKTTAIKDRMVELNKTINWKPKSTGEGRFGNWLENMVDWNLSRSRFWGTPLPIWKTEEGEEEICIGSIAELKTALKRAIDSGCLKLNAGEDPESRIQHLVSDLHKPYVDEIILVSKSGKPMKRVPDLIDVWFDSGAMPYAQWGLPDTSSNEFGPLSAENFFKYHKASKVSPIGEDLEGTAFPADFIAEGVDQTRGWFYTLHAIAVLVFDSVAYKTCVSNGLVLDKNGNKMSKRLGNVVDPFKTIQTFGADATRWYLVTNASPWDNMKFDLDGIKEVQRKFFGTLYNTYQFFALYANVDGFAFTEKYVPLADRPEIDRWILSSLNTIVKKVNEYMDDYEPTQAGRVVEDFVDEHLSNWYVRLCRRRFWKGEYEHDKVCAYQTLYECLETVLRLIAPISPFFSDAIFNNLDAITNRFRAGSIHHLDFPVADEKVIDTSLEERMQLAQDASSLILSLRKKQNIKVRQPLQKVLIPVLNGSMKEQLQKVEDLVKAEVNVKEIEYLNPDNTFIRKKIKPNFVALGKKLGPKMKLVSALLGQLTQDQIRLFEKEGQYNLPVDGEDLILQASEVEITSEDIPGWLVASKGQLTVALDVTITEELEHEGNAREFVNRIQKIRKDSGFELTDRIEVGVMAENARLPDRQGLKNSLAQFKDYICAEILADKLEFLPVNNSGIEIEVNDIQLKVIVLKKA
ncbi:MAG TPA: isoleucine--tRNA ligase [Chitinophagaceae bacterium]|nr:isoleucine--tRNA ligase [Chitinophagaceae bacterium]